MIKIENLTKIYTTKNSESVKALDNFSLTLQNKGLIFILGKSGSGKSTLLNVLSGLDKFDNGNIIINGKSLNNFTQTEKDNYRNSYIGFIFQEYNLLKEFNVEDNIALSLNLQGKLPKQNEISNLLKSLDLEGYEKRNITELSGGEMQRVTIARALIKNPHLIIADEPSGAVDYKTSTQIFNILKNLSKDRLILVVSHDRDSAYTYGDRIIELSDGKIVNDYSCKTNDNIELNTKIKSDEELLLKDKELSQLENDILNKKDCISYFNRSFEKTNLIDNKNNEQELELISSKLPINKALKISVSTFKNKKTNLFFSILLCVLAFTFFIVASSLLMYDKVTAQINSLYNSINYTSISLNYPNDESLLTVISKKYFSLLNEKYGKDFLFATYVNNTNLKYKNLTDTSKLNSIEKQIYPNDTRLLCGTSYDTLMNNGYKLMCNTCRFPQNKDEVLITDYLFSMFKKGGYIDADNVMYTINSCNDIINKKIKIAGKIFTISGVLDIGFDFDKISSYSDIKGNVYDSFSFDTIVHSIKDNSPYNVIYLNEDAFYDLYFSKINPFCSSLNYKLLDSKETCYFSLFKDDSNFVFFDNDKSTLNDDEIILSELLFLKKTFGTSLPKCDATGFEKDNVIENNVIFPNYKSFNNIINNIFKVASYKFILENTEYVKTAIKNNKSNYATSLNDSEIDNLDLKNLLDLFCNCKVLDNTFYDFYLDYIEELRSKYDLKNYLLPKDIILLFDKKYNVGSETISLLDIKKPFGKDFYSAYNSISIKKFAYENITLCREFYEKNKEEVVFLDIDAINFTINAINNNENLLVNYSKIYKEYLLSKIDSFNAIYEKLNYNYNLKYVNENTNEEISLNIVGLNFKNVNIVNSNNFHKFIDTDNFILADNIFCSIPKDKSDLKTFLKKINTFNLEISNNKYETNLTDYISTELKNINILFSFLGKIFIVCGVVFGIFACLLFFNYISLSIIYKKKDIGIIRALGAKNKDIFIIFLIESLIISAIVYTLSILVSVLAISFINIFIENILRLITNILVLNIKQFLLLFVIILLLAFVGTYMPIKKISKDNPIENIRN